MVDENEVEGTITEGVGKLKDAAGGLTGDTTLQAKGKIDQLQGKVQSEYGDLLESAQDQLEDVTELVREQPFAALGIAAGVGFLLGYLLMPSRN
ncbi:CsbD family protein [Lichenicola sp.]|uniref:CsbD family protein n=1 Tax=Lichenicola sp. TaxID=2804529 RepID=UPI003B007D13